MIEKPLQWIERHASRSAATPGLTAGLIPTLRAAGRFEAARQLAIELVRRQRPEGSFGPTGEFAAQVFETGLAIRGWLALLGQMPELEAPLRSACDWLLLRADPEKASLNGLPAIPNQGGLEAWCETARLYSLHPLEQASECLGEDRYGRLARQARDQCIRKGPALNFDAPGVPTRFLAYSLQAWRELGCDSAVGQGLKAMARHQQDNGAVPAQNDVKWICPASLALLARTWLDGGEAERGRRALQFLSLVQNPGGGFFGAYGLNAPPAPASREDPWAVKHYLDACLKARGNPNGESAASALAPQAAPIRKDRVLLVSYLEDSNLGDAWITEVLRDRLAQAGLRTQHLEVSLGIARSRMIERAGHSGFVCFPGGGLLERGVPEIIARFAELGPRLAAPYGVLGLSSGSFDYSHCHRSLKAFADQARFFYTRDTETVETFRRAGAAKLPVAGADVVFLHDQVRANRRRGQAVGANFRDVPYPDLTGDLDWHQWACALRAVGASLLVPDCSPADMRLGLPRASSAPLDAIAECEFLVAMRFHVVLAAAVAGVIPIPVVYCPKVARLATQLGLQEYCLGLHEAPKLAATLERLRAEAGSIRQRMAERVRALARNAEQIVSAAVDQIKTTSYA